jgi:hypothetical protein
MKMFNDALDLYSLSYYFKFSLIISPASVTPESVTTYSMQMNLSSDRPLNILQIRLNFLSLLGCRFIANPLGMRNLSPCNLFV